MQPENVIPTFLISFVVMLLTEASVKESDGIRKEQIYPASPLRTATQDAPWIELIVIHRIDTRLRRKSSFIFLTSPSCIKLTKTTLVCRK